MINPTLIQLCKCGHQKRDHVQFEGCCRPGFVCSGDCEWFVPRANDTQAKLEEFCEKIEDGLKLDPLKCNHAEMAMMMQQAILDDPSWDGIVVCRNCGLNMRRNGSI